MDCSYPVHLGRHCMMSPGFCRVLAVPHIVRKISEFAQLWKVVLLYISKALQSWLQVFDGFDAWIIYIYRFDIQILQISSLIQQEFKKNVSYIQKRGREKAGIGLWQIHLFASSWAMWTHMSLHIHAEKPCAYKPKFDFKPMSLGKHSGNLDPWKVELLVILTTKESKCLRQPPDPRPKPWYILAQSFGARPFVLWQKRHISFQVETCSKQRKQRRVTKELQVLLVSTWLSYRTIYHMNINTYMMNQNRILGRIPTQLWLHLATNVITADHQSTLLSLVWRGVWTWHWRELILKALQRNSPNF